MFGDNILATALCQPLDPATGKTERKMWFPEGSDWYDMAHHRTHRGGSVKTLYYAIDENPWYVKAGSVIPLAGEGIRNLQTPDNRLRLLVVPGAGNSRFSLYEDDGVSQAYDTDYAVTLIEKSLKGKKMQLTVNPRKGSYKNARETRRIDVVLEGMAVKPSSAKVNGKPAESVVRGTATIISIPECNVAEKSVVTVELK